MPPVNRNKPVRAKSSESRYSLMEFLADFPDDKTCLEWLWTTRYAADGEHAYCEKCGQTRKFSRYYTKQQRQSWTCNGCGHHVHPTAGTIFHKSSTSLHLWFYAMYLMTSTRCGISAKQLERELGVTYKTAWRMFHLIRNELMVQDDEPLSGAVEMDETYVGGKRKVRHQPRMTPAEARARREAGLGNRRSPVGGRLGRPGAGHKTKRPVFGMVERQGRVRAVHVDKVNAATLLPHVVKYVMPDSVVYTDEWGAYRGLARQGFDHRTIRHNDGVYVSGDIHTNTIEGFWSLVKRGLSGTHHMVSAKHLQGYLNEYVWRSALDYVITALVESAGGRLTRGHQFPIYTDETLFDRHVGTAANPTGCVVGIPAAAFDVIRGVQPFQFLNPTADDQAALASLHRLSNSDKHRKVLAFAAPPRRSEVHIKHNGRIVEEWQPAGRFRWQPHVPMQLLGCRFAEPYPTVLKRETKLVVDPAFVDDPFLPDYPDPLVTDIEGLGELLVQVDVILSGIAAL